jgi:hypothetical protein
MPVWPLPTWRHCTAGSRLPPDHACDVADPRALAFADAGVPPHCGWRTWKSA